MYVYQAKERRNHEHHNRHHDPTWDELATEAEEIGYPLESCRKLLDLFCGSSIEDSEHSSHVAEAIIALIDKADRKRERLEERLDRLAKSERTGISQDQP